MGNVWMCIENLCGNFIKFKINANNIAKSLAKVHGLEAATNTVACYIDHQEVTHIMENRT